MILAIPFPDIDPIAIEIGPLAIRWYALAWIAGFIFGWRYCLMLARRSPWKITRDHIDDFLVWAIIATMVGGRLGYVLFYNPGYYLDHPLQIFAVWRGGMAFHGAIIGLVVAMAIFARRRGLRFLAFGDIIVAAGPIGILLGRIANFINGELFGRPTDVPWAVVFPRGGEVPRHPSQIYEAGLEGLVLFILLWVLATRARALDRPGLVGGAFLVGYALARGTVELFRAPDAHIGFLPGGTTLGQWLTVPMLAFGLYLVARALRRAG
ncbi:MAG: prolipoprotein diacylglyceryl transferase [Alphaproteobacteria bacterium]